ERRMEACRALDDHPAEIIIAGDLLALPLAGHHRGARLGGVIEAGEALFLARVMIGRPGADKTPALPPAALDRLLVDQPLDQREGIRGIRQQAAGALRIDLGRAAREARAESDPAPNPAH